MIVATKSIDRNRRQTIPKVPNVRYNGKNNFTIRFSIRIDSNIALQVVLTIALPHRCTVGGKQGCGGQIRGKMSAQGGLMIILPRPQTRRCYCANQGDTVVTYPRSYISLRLTHPIAPYYVTFCNSDCIYIRSSQNCICLFVVLEFII